MNLLITIKTEPITAGMLFKSKPVFLQTKQNYMNNSVLTKYTGIPFFTYRPNRSLNGAAIIPPKTPPSARTEIAVEYKIS